MKFLLFVFVIFNIVKCSESCEPIVLNDKEIANLHGSATFDGVLNEYIDYLKTQKEKEKLSKNIISVYFNLIEKDTFMYITNSKFLGSFTLDSNNKWLYIKCFNNKTIIIGDDKSSPVGETIYKKRNLNILKNDSTYKSIHSFSDYYCDDCNWKFIIKGRDILRIQL